MLRGIWNSSFHVGNSFKKSLLRWGALNLAVSACLISTAVSENGSPSRVTAAKAITIAIVDTGIDIRHPFIADNIWKNSGEVGIDSLGRDKSSNGIDDDNNGYVDDVYGWNFANNSNDITDDDGHGTHIAGSIKQTVHKVNPFTPFKLMPIKYFNSKNGTNHKEAFIQSLKYAIDAGVSIINISGGGGRFDEREFALLRKARDKGILVVAAAGNKSKDSSFGQFFPAAYELSNVISVAATDSSGILLDTSNINQTRENALMPGQKIFSTLPRNRFGFKTGSSQAAAIYTGHYIVRVALQAVQPGFDGMSASAM